MKTILKNIVDSFNNIPGTGYSSKKLSAFVVMLCVMAAHVKWISLGDFSQLEMVLTIDFTFIATMFGINEYGKKINPKKSDDAGISQ
jgi:hypothetical protein